MMSMIDKVYFPTITTWYAVMNTAELMKCNNETKLNTVTVVI